MRHAPSDELLCAHTLSKANPSPLRRAYRGGSGAEELYQAAAQVKWLEANGQAAAAASVPEGLEERLTVVTLGLLPTPCAASRRPATSRT